MYNILYILYYIISVGIYYMQCHGKNVKLLNKYLLVQNIILKV